MFCLIVYEGRFQGLLANVRLHHVTVQAGYYNYNLFTIVESFLHNCANYFKWWNKIYLLGHTEMFWEVFEKQPLSSLDPHHC